jgi:hypothetical protein
VLGLNVDGNISRQLIRKVLVPALWGPHPKSGCVTAVSRFSVHLHYTAEMASIMAVALVKRMEAEQSGEALVQLGEALDALSSKLEPKDVQPGAAVLVQRMEIEKDRRTLESLGKVLAALSPKLQPKDVQPLAAALVQRMEAEQSGEVPVQLGWMLAALSAKL